MIDELHIAGLGVIEDTTLRLSPGLTVVSGETGAGKTMVVTALQLLLGARADAALVRTGAELALVEARLAPVPTGAVEGGWASPSDDELVVVREVTASPDGERSRVRIGGRLAPVSALQDVLGRWAEVHAQGGHVRLGRPDVQRRLLDRYAGEPHGRNLAGYREAYRTWREAEQRLARRDADARDRAREVDRLTHEVVEIERAGLDPAVDGDIPRELERLEHAEQLTAAAATAAAALGDDGAGGPLGVAVSTLRQVAGHDPALHELLGRLETAVAEAADLRTDLRRYAETVDADPAHLEALRHRSRLLRDLERRYGSDVAAVLAYAEQARRRLDELTGEEADAEQLARQAEELRGRTARLAGAITAGRRAAGQQLAAAVDRHLADLAMPNARLRVRLDPADEMGPHGADRAVFELAANPGEPPRLLHQAASGGERSRVALAVEVALADVDEARILVFDEVDAGVGGAVAMAVGEKLARLGAGRQVLCVTHLAQLAAYADVHYVVEKRLRGGRTVTAARRVSEADRPAELARMLSGSAQRATGLQHARELLSEAAERLAG